MQALERDDQACAKISELRRIISPLAAPRLPTKLFAAWPPRQLDVLRCALGTNRCNVAVWVASLGGARLLILRVGRTTDFAAIEQTAESLPNAELRRAVSWAVRRHGTGAERLTRIIDGVKARRAPVGLRSLDRPTASPSRRTPM